MLESYDNMVFSSKEVQKQWDEMPDYLRKTTLNILKQNIQEKQREILEELQGQSLKK